MDRLFPLSSSGEPRKACRKCGAVKPLSEFYPQKGMKDGHRHDCKACHNAHHMDWYAGNRDAEIARITMWKQTNRERVNASNRRRRVERGDELKRKEREGHLRRKYGLTNADYDFLVAVQAGACAICGRPDPSGLHVDHEHDTGLVRGLLCGRCNKAIGLFDEEPARLEAAKSYLGRNQLPLACGDRRRASR